MQNQVQEITISQKTAAFLNRLATMPDNRLRLYLILFTIPVITVAYFIHAGVNFLPVLFTSLFLLLWAPNTRQVLLCMDQPQLISGLMRAIPGILIGFGVLAFSMPVAMWPLGYLGLKVNMGLVLVIFSLTGLKSKQNIVLQALMPAPFSIKVAKEKVVKLDKPMTNTRKRYLARQSRKNGSK